MKRYISAGLASLMIFNVLTLAFSPSFDNFTAVNTYETGVFSDVASNAWYNDSIKNTYELGLLTGVLDGKFGVDTNITIAHSLTIACRLHSIYNGGDGVFEQGDVWYQVYVDYAIENNIISDSDFSDYNKTATRAEFAGILYCSIGDGGFDEINQVTSLPDVTVATTNYNAIMALFNAGVLTGNDEYGTFSPNSYITRAEVSAVVYRVADVSARKNFVLTDIKLPFVDIDTTYVSIDAGESKTINYITYLLDGITPVWSSNNTSVCVVDQNGVITGVSKGTALINVNVGGYKDAFTVSVTGDVIVSDKTNGEIFASVEYVTKYNEYIEKYGLKDYSYNDFITDILNGKLSYFGDADVETDDENAEDTEDAEVTEDTEI